MRKILNDSFQHIALILHGLDNEHDHISSLEKQQYYKHSDIEDIENKDNSNVIKLPCHFLPGDCVIHYYLLSIQCRNNHPYHFL